MSANQWDRRALLGALGAGCAAGLGPQAFGDDAYPFSARVVREAAKRLADQPFTPPPSAPAALKALDYDAYRRITYDTRKAIWRGARTPFSIELFAPGYLYEVLVDIFVVESSRARPVPLGPDTFQTGGLDIGDALAAVAKFAGFRLHYPLGPGGTNQEFLVFQGASYFRAVSSGQTYGLSARGLAIDVAERTGEEFPLFRTFWIERPSADADAIVVHALLDSPRVTGAYRFGIYPGRATAMDVSATLFAREPLAHIGVAPLTSMYLFGPSDRGDAPDYRPAVHDSQGLAVHTGAGERLWRPLMNPESLQMSAFLDDNPNGFGLIQRPRLFSQYQDLEALYHTRPSAWVTPRGDWGPGHVQLVEIPTPHEGNDNIVAYWRPRDPLVPGAPRDFAYRLTWKNNHRPRPLAQVARTAFGRAVNGGGAQYVVDFAPDPSLPALSSQPIEAFTPVASASAGRITGLHIQPNPQTDGLRVFLDFDPEGASLSELRLQVLRNGGAIGETWLHRWLSR